jgi:hypothetical protein
MATPIDVGLLGTFSPIFVFIFVFAVSYAALTMTKVLGKDNGNIVGVIAFCIAIFVTLSTKPRLMIPEMVPWFAMIIIFFMFLMLAMRFVFGEKGGDEVLMKVLGGGGSSSAVGAGWWVFIMVIGVVVIGLSASVGPEVTPGSNDTSINLPSAPGTGSTQTGSWNTNMLNTLFHPKLLGTVLILIIALSAIRMLSTIPK